MATPLCRHFGTCGGCNWQHLTYQEQLERKRRQLGELLHAALGPRAPAIEPMVGMSVDHTGWPWGFRHKAAFVFGNSAAERALVIGHYAASSRTVVPIAECPVHASRANQLAFALHDHLAREGVPAAGSDLRGVLRHLIVRSTRDDREAVAMLVVTRNDKALRRPIKAFLATEDAPDGFYLNVHDKPGPYMVGRDTRRLAGRSHVRETVGGLSFLVTPTTFFQTNVEAAERLLSLVLEAAGSLSQARVLDLYAGSGLFTLPLAARGHHVTAVEENPQAIRDTDANMRLNRISAERVQLHPRRVEELLPRFERSAFDLVLLDPPREGCSPAVLRSVFARMKPPRAVYISCNPEALARELPLMLAGGYEVRRTVPVDMFPHTPHIETLVSLERREGKSGRRQAAIGAD